MCSSKLMLLPSTDQREREKERERSFGFICESGDCGVEETLKIYLYKYIYIIILYWFIKWSGNFALFSIDSCERKREIE